MNTSQDRDYQRIIEEIERIRQSEQTEDDRALAAESQEIEALREIVEEISEPRQIFFTST
jgi:hypothetical protein